MSIAVSLEQLRDEISGRGSAAFAISVGERGPHVVSLRVAWDGDHLVGRTGGRTAANVERNPAVTLLWPSPTFDGFTLLVDGTAVAAEGQLRVTPQQAVLHRSAEAASDGPTCVRVLE